MMLFFDKGFVFRELREKPGGKIRNAIEQIYTDREICTKDHRTVAVADDLLDLRSRRVPSRRSFNNRHTG